MAEQEPLFWVSQSPRRNLGQQNVDLADQGGFRLIFIGDQRATQFQKGQVLIRHPGSRFGVEVGGEDVG